MIKCAQKKVSSVRLSADICKLLNKVDTVHLYCGPVCLMLFTVDLYDGVHLYSGPVAVSWSMYILVSKTVVIEY